MALINQDTKASPVPSGSSAKMAPEIAVAIGHAKAAKVQATRRAYGTDFQRFGAWCKGVASFPTL